MELHAVDGSHATRLHHAEQGTEGQIPTADLDSLKRDLRALGLGEEFLGRMTHILLFRGLDRDSIEEILKRLKLTRSFGFNAVRFHSMIPTSKYFEAADEVGMLIMAELPASYTMHFLPHREYLKGEMESALQLYRNHPSFLSLAFGNEFLHHLKECVQLRGTLQRLVFLDDVGDR